MHPFLMIRDEDVSGVSGTGIVAEGVVFSDGRVAIRWMVKGTPCSTVVWDSIEDAIAVHGHEGRTHVSFAADVPWPPAEMHEHEHRWTPLRDDMEDGDDGPYFCTDCGTYSRIVPDE